MAAAAASKSLQACLTLCDPIDSSPPGSPSLGFSRQEHWSELPFPSPMHESEKWKWSRSVMSDPQRPHGLQPTRLLHPWDFPGKSTGVGCHCLLQLGTVICGLKANSSSQGVSGLKGGGSTKGAVGWARKICSWLLPFFWLLFLMLLIVFLPHHLCYHINSFPSIFLCLFYRIPWIWGFWLQPS